MPAWTSVAPSNTRPAGSGPGMTATTPVGMTYVGGGVPWVDENVAPDKHCIGVTKLGDKCGGYKVKNSDWCAGHIRQQEVSEVGE